MLSIFDYAQSFIDLFMGGSDELLEEPLSTIDDIAEELRCDSSSRDRTVAIKVLRDFTPDRTIRRIIENWRRFEHPHVVRMFGASIDMESTSFLIVSEVYECGNLKDWLLAAARDDCTTRNQVDQFRFMCQIADGMKYLHDEGLVHGDLKCSNVLVGNEGNCAITEFGLNEFKEESYKLTGYKRPEGSSRWKAPECLDGTERPTMKGDVYAFSICCTEILNMGDIPYGTRDDEDVKRIVLEQGARPEFIETPLAATVLPVMNMCWADDPSCRPPFSMVVTALSTCQNYASRASSGALHSPVADRWLSRPPSSDLRVCGTPTYDEAKHEEPESSMSNLT